jgi:hypothetical protein
MDIFFMVRETFGESGGCQRFGEISRSLTFSREANELRIRSQAHEIPRELQRNPETALQQRELVELVSLYSREMSPPTLSIFA